MKWKKMKLYDFLSRLETLLPPETAMDGDKIGLQIESEVDFVTKVLLCYEINSNIIKEATEQNCNCIISFHPLIFNPLNKISFNDRTAKLCYELIQNKLNLIIIHTNFDTFSEGTSKILSNKLNLHFQEFLIPDKNYTNFGMGVISIPERPISQNDLLERVKNVCSSPLRYSSGKNKDIETIAIVGGSGSSFIPQVLKKNIDAFITADVSYHKFHQTKDKLMLIDPGHYEMEQFVPFGMYELLKNESELSSIEFIASEICTNPVDYYPDTENFKKLQKLKINKYQ